MRRFLFPNPFFIDQYIVVTLDLQCNWSSFTVILSPNEHGFKVTPPWCCCHGDVNCCSVCCCCRVLVLKLHWTIYYELLNRRYRTVSFSLAHNVYNRCKRSSESQKQGFPWRCSPRPGRCQCAGQMGAIPVTYYLCLYNLFTHVFVSKWLMGTAIFEIGPLLSEQCNPSGRLYTVNIRPLKALVFATDTFRGLF